MPRFLRFTRTQILKLRQDGLVECVNLHRKLYRFTHRANVLTTGSRLRSGGLVSTAVPISIQDSLADLMGEHAA